MTEKNEVKNKAEPFFARFLDQQVPAVKTDIKAGPPPFGGGGGGGHVTMKWPSDDDEGETS